MKYMLMSVLIVSLLGWYIVDGRYSYTNKGGTVYARVDRLTGSTSVCSQSGCTR